MVRTSEIFVIDPRGWKLVYRGPLDDRLSYEKQRPATKHYLTDALDDVLAGRAVKCRTGRRRRLSGEFSGPRPQAVARADFLPEKIAPLLEEKCVACHQVGGVGPWAMTSYDMSGASRR